MKKKLCLCLLATCAAFGLASCGETEGSSEGLDDNNIYVNKDWSIYQNSDVTEDVKITFSTLHAATAKQGIAVKSLVDKFNEAQQAKTSGGKITVEVEYGDGNTVNQNTKLWAAYPARSNPEVAYVGVSSVAMYEEMAVDLRNVFTYDQIRDFDEGLLQYSLYKGKLVSVPFAPSSNVLVVNKTLWESKGATLPTVESIVNDPDSSTWNWENFKANCLALKDDDHYGFGTNAMDEYGMMVQQGGSLYNLDMTEATFNNEKGVNALTYWRDLHTSGAMKIKTTVHNTDLNIVNDFKAGKVAAIWQSTSSLASNIKNASEAGFEMAVMPFPKQTNFFANQGGNSMIVFNNKSKLKTAAASEFVRYMNSAEAVSSLAIQTGYFPTTKAAKETEVIKNLYSSNPTTFKASSQLLKFGTRAPQGVAKAAVDSKFSKEVKQIFDNPEKSIQTILDELYNEIQYTLDISK